MEQDDYATIRAAEAAGARIQAYTVDPAVDDGSLPLECVYGAASGYWRTLEEPAQWTCHPSRYRVEAQA